MSRIESAALVLTLCGWSAVAGYLYAQQRANRFHVVPGYSWAIDGRTGQLCDPWPMKYETAVKDSEGIPYCAKLR